MNINGFPIFEQWVGWGILFVYFLMVLGLTRYFAKGYSANKNSFLVARRELGGFAGALSIGAAWTWAPAIFISAQMAFQSGLAGLFWFTVGNTLTMVLFGIFAKKIRHNLPDGFTISGYMKEKFSGRVQNIFLLEVWVLATCAFALNALAGAKTIETITGINYHFSTIVLSGIALLYVIQNGLKASVVTEIFKIFVLWTGLAIFIPWVISNAGGIDVLQAGLGGVTGLGDSLFGNEFVINFFLGVGFSMALGHLGAFWGDNSFYQRAFAIKKDKIITAFTGSALVFVVVPVSVGLLGFIAAGQGLDISPESVGMTTVITLGANLPSWTLILFVFILFAGLVSVLDSHLSSSASLFGHDVRNKIKSSKSEVFWGRSGMLVMIVLALIIANWPGMTILTIFLFYGIMRATIWLPTMLHLMNPKIITERGIFWGIVLAYSIGFPIYLYGKFFDGGNTLTIAGTLFAILGSGIMSYLISLRDRV
jgi:Na+/proline symporter